MKKIIPLLLISFVIGIGVNYISHEQVPSIEQFRSTIEKDLLENLEKPPLDAKESLITKEPLKLEEEKDLSVEEDLALDGNNDINAKYEQESVNLQAEAYSELNKILEEAKHEYTALSPFKRVTAKYALGLKYMNKISKMEEEYDQRYELMIDEMKKELENQGLSTNLAIEIQQQYEENKDTLRETFLSKVKENY